MKFTMTKIAAGLILGIAATGAQAIDITSMSVTGGSFFMGGFTPSPILYESYGTGAANLIGYHNGSGGAHIADTAYDPAGTVGFVFGSQTSHKTINTYTAASNMGDINSAAGLIPGGPPVSASVTSFTNGSTLTVDLSSFFMNYNGMDFHQGSGVDASGVPDGSFALGTLSGCGADTCNYSISWNSYAVGGSIDGYTTSWVVTGVVAVPEASTYGMMFAGLVLVGGIVARHRRMMA